MSKKDDALKLALEYRPTMDKEVLHSWATEMKKAVQEALAERPARQQEPEHIVHSNGRYSPLLTRMMNERVKSNVKQVIELYDSPEQPEQQDEFKAAYIEAMFASNEAGFSGMSAAETIRELSRMVAEQPAQPQQEPAYWFDPSDFAVLRSAVFDTVPQSQRRGWKPLYTSPPAQRKPLTDEQQIAESLRVHGLTLVKTAGGYEVLRLGQITANNIKEQP